MPSIRQSERLRGKKKPTYDEHELEPEGLTNEAITTCLVHHQMDAETNDSLVANVGLGDGVNSTQANKPDIEPVVSLRRGRGKLANLLDMPLDILYEIFGYLHPLDLLRLSRLTKALRGVILKRSARSVWKDALAAVDGMPSCPPDMQEPQWARLVFDTRCHFCCAVGSKAVLWVLRVRTCKECLYSDRNDSAFISLSRTDVLQGCLPFADYRYSERGRSRDIRFLRKEYEEVKAHYASLNEDYAAAFVKQKQHEATVRMSDQVNKEYSVWLEELQSDRQRVLEGIRAKRLNEILDRLGNIGYHKEIIYMQNTDRYVFEDFRSRKLVNISQPLTNKGWEKIHPILTPLLDRMREQRLHELKNTRIRKRIDLIFEGLEKYRLAALHQEQQDIPSIVEICYLESFKQVLDLPIEDTDEDIVTSDTFKSAFKLLPDSLRDWDRKRELRLLTLLHECDKAKFPNGLDGKGIEVAKQKLSAASEVKEAIHMSRSHLLSSALAVFRCKCKNDSALFTAQEALDHFCPNNYYGFLDTGLTGFEAVLAELSTSRWNFQRFLPWNYQENISVSHESRLLISFLARSSSLIPETTTRADMDLIDGRYTCAHKDCEISSKQKVFDWRSMVVHAYQVHQTATPDALAKQLSPEHAEVARKVEQARPLLDMSYMDIWGCKHCSELKNNLPGTLERHLREIHSISEPTLVDCSANIPDSFVRRIADPVRVELNQEKPKEVVKKSEE